MLPRLFHRLVPATMVAVGRVTAYELGPPPGLDVTAVLLAMPTCAAPTVATELAAANCSLTDINLFADCLCTNITLQSRMSTSVQTSCKFGDQLSKRLIPLSPLLTSAEGTFADSVLEVVELETALCAAYPKESRVNEIRIASIMFYVAQILYILVQVFAKVAIVMLYLRVFTTPWFKWACWAFVAFMFGHGAIFSLLIVFQCIPVAAVWDRFLSSRCLNVNAVGWAGAVLSIIEDIVLMILPIPELMKLQITGRKRTGVGIMFSIASL
ncbi:hypothetical protein CH35J_000700 [Colletotrichum higginsianum]|uniref:Uncharacterized protein n=1 Tax=Colletotrichum higginsianum TaxID=80884 RepID=A0A4T0WI95_9PEZI|nr:hypothetical protein CH35J_000700 [Colletotrichum higginsianum]